MFWLYLTALFALILFECVRKRRLPVDWLTLLNVVVGIYYLCVPLLHLYAGDTIRWRALVAFPEASQSGLTFCAIVMATVAVIAGFQLGEHLKIAHVELRLHRMGDRFIFVYGAAVILAFGLLSLTLAMSSGGIGRFLAMASEVRAGRASRGLIQYAQYAFDVAPYLLLLVLAASPSSRFSKPLRTPIVLLVFGMVVFLALATAGRANLLMPFVFAFLLWLNGVEGRRRWFAPLVVLMLVIAMAVVVAYGKAAYWELDSLATGGVGVWIERIAARQARLFGDASPLTGLAALMGYFDHHVASLYAAIDRPGAYEIPRLFLDWPRAVVSYSPGLEQPDFIVTNTPSGHGRALFHQAGMIQVGYIPPGWIAMNYINLQWLGVVIPPFLSGCLAGVTHRILRENLHSAGWLMGAYVALGWMWVMFGLGPDPFMAFPLLAFSLFILLPVLAATRVRRLV